MIIEGRHDDLIHTGGAAVTVVEHFSKSRGSVQCRFIEKNDKSLQRLVLLHDVRLIRDGIEENHGIRRRLLYGKSTVTALRRIEVAVGKVLIIFGKRSRTIRGIFCRREVKKAGRLRIEEVGNFFFHRLVLGKEFRLIGVCRAVVDQAGVFQCTAGVFQKFALVVQCFRSGNLYKVDASVGNGATVDERLILGTCRVEVAARAERTEIRDGGKALVDGLLRILGNRKFCIQLVIEKSDGLIDDGVLLLLIKRIVSRCGIQRVLLNLIHELEKYFAALNEIDLVQPDVHQVDAGVGNRDIVVQTTGHACRGVDIPFAVDQCANGIQLDAGFDRLRHADDGGKAGIRLFDREIADFATDFREIVTHLFTLRVGELMRGDVRGNGAEFRRLLLRGRCRFYLFDQSVHFCQRTALRGGDGNCDHRGKGQCHGYDQQCNQ